MPESTPAAPEPIDDGLSEAPDTPEGEASGVGQAPSGGPDRPTTGPGSPSPDGPQRPAPPTVPGPPAPAPAPAGGKGGCLSMVLGLIVLVAALLGIAAQF
ncbi:hypothetical protein [Dactylosporangium sp. NPDC005555]|uniref:hypothetical protein n=1 Tax=Dactylosporangium sp. NPDC005555 TaxID=3154889 RepID=UPI0033AD6416